MTRCLMHTRYRLASCPTCRAQLQAQLAAAGGTPAGVLIALPTPRDRKSSGAGVRSRPSSPQIVR